VRVDEFRLPTYGRSEITDERYFICSRRQ